MPAVVRQRIGSTPLRLSLIPVLILLTGFVFASSIQAQEAAGQSGAETSKIDPGFAPPPNLRPPFNFLGQEHSYSVTFRGNGEAIVSAKIIFSNLGNSPLTDLTFRVPKVDPKDLVAYRVLREPRCLNDFGRPVEIQEGADSSGEMMRPVICNQAEEPNYYEGFYESSKYQKLRVDQKLDTVSIALERPVKPNSSGSVIVYFRAFGYAKRNILGAYQFNFETLKSSDKISKLQVGINVDSDLYLRGARGKVNYRFDDSVMSLKMPEGAPTSSSQFDSFYSQVGQGEIVKTASNLEVMESYSVRGSYSDAKIKLYGKEISFSVLAAVLVIFLFVSLLRRVLRRASGEGAAPKAGVGPVVNSDHFLMIAVLGASFVSSILILGYTLAIIFFSQSLNSFYPYGFNGALFVLALLVSLGIYMVLLLTPPLFWSVKRGIWWGLSAFALTILWLIIYLVIGILFLYFFNQRLPTPYSIPMMNRIEKGSEPGEQLR